MFVANENVSLKVIFFTSENICSKQIINFLGKGYVSGWNNHIFEATKVTFLEQAIFSKEIDNFVSNQAGRAAAAATAAAAAVCCFPEKYAQF